MAEIEDHIQITITEDHQPFPMIGALLNKLGGVAEVTEEDLAYVDGLVLDVTLYKDPTLPMVIRLCKKSE